MGEPQLFHDPGLGPHQVAIVDASKRVKYRRPWDSNLVIEAIRAPGYFVAGPATLISRIAGKLVGPIIVDILVNGSGRGCIGGAGTDMWAEDEPAADPAARN